jgi:cell division septum initiation protein DivIVA
MEDQMKIENLEKENEELKQRVAELEEKLKKYTAPARSKTYYENHKEELIQKTKEYKDNLSSEKKKEYARKAYLKKKEKMSQPAII